MFHGFVFLDYGRVRFTQVPQAAETLVPSLSRCVAVGIHSAPELAFDEYVHCKSKTTWSEYVHSASDLVLGGYLHCWASVATPLRLTAWRTTGPLDVRLATIPLGLRSLARGTTTPGFKGVVVPYDLPHRLSQTTSFYTLASRTNSGSKCQCIDEYPLVSRLCSLLFHHHGLCRWCWLGFVLCSRRPAPASLGWDVHLRGSFHL